MIGAPVSIDVRADGSTIQFDIDGEQRTFNTTSATAPTLPLSKRLIMAGKHE